MGCRQEKRLPERPVWGWRFHWGKHSTAVVSKRHSILTSLVWFCQLALFNAIGGGGAWIKLRSGTSDLNSLALQSLPVPRNSWDGMSLYFCGKRSTWCLAHDRYWGHLEGKIICRFLLSWRTDKTHTCTQISPL